MLDASPKSQPSSLAGKTLLLVDDEEDILWSLKTFFENTLKGISVKGAKSGPEALEVLKKAAIDLIVTDYKMPGMDGIQFLQKANMLTPHVPSIMITAYPDPQLAARAVKEAGVGLFIAKPFDLDYLVTMVKAILEKQNAG